MLDVEAKRKGDELAHAFAPQAAEPAETAVSPPTLTTMLPQAADPSASDRAYGSPLHDAQTVKAGTETAKAKPNPSAEFDRLQTGMASENAPAEIQLPAAAQRGMQAAWDASKGGTTGAQEQGGNLVRTHGGKGGYEWRAGKPGNDSTFVPDYEDVAKGQKLVGVGHTHPYKSGKENVSFSGEDISSIVDEKQPINLLQSGKTQYVIARTAQFEKLIHGKNDEQLEILKKSIESTWYAAFGPDGANQPDGVYQQRVERAVKTTCATFDLAYYEGQGGTLQRIA